MRANIRQVADRAGVSRTTVSNVLLGRQDIVSPDKFEAVLQAVRELEYVPVRSALQNRRLETRVIVVPMGDPNRLRWEFHNTTYRGVCEGALEHRYDVLNLLRPNPDWALDRQEVQFLDRRGDGIIFAMPDQGETPDTYNILARNGIPTVVCYRRDVPDAIAWVDADNEGAVSGAVTHLVQRGHRRIAHLTHSGPDYDAAARRRSFTDVMYRCGIDECANWIVDAPGARVTLETAHRILALEATAVVCYNDGMAIELWEAMKTGGFSVPEDLSIVGIDDIAESAARGLTTMAYSADEVGRKAVQSLVDCLGGAPASECRCVVPVRLCERQSVRTLSG